MQLAEAAARGGKMNRFYKALNHVSRTICVKAGLYVRESLCRSFVWIVRGHRKPFVSLHVSGHEFTRAVKVPLKLRALAPVAPGSLQGLKPFTFAALAARLKSCSDTCCLTQALLILALGALPLAAQQGMVASHASTPVAPAAAKTAPAAGPSSPEMKQAVARVNGAAITQFDLLEQMQRMFPYSPMHGGKVPEKYQDEIRKKSLDQLVMEELIYQDARRRGMVVTPAMMQKVVRSAKERLGSPKAYQDYARSAYGSVAEFERRLRRARLIAEYEHREIELKSKVTEQQVRELYDKNKEKMFRRPEMVRLQTISVTLPPEASEDQKKLARKRIQEILPQARAAKTFNEFGVLAERVSEDDYRVNMGDHHLLPITMLPPVLAKPAASLQPGQMSDIVETEISYTILRLEERSPEKLLGYAEVKSEIRERMEQGRAKKRWESLTAQLRKSAHIEVL